MEESRKVSLREVLENIGNELAEIRVPVGMMEEIGAPVAKAVGNLRQCVLAIDQAEQAAEIAKAAKAAEEAGYTGDEATEAGGAENVQD